MGYEPLHRGDSPAGRPTPLAEELDRVLAGLGSPPASSLAAVQRAWGELVGPAAAVALVPTAIRDGTLLVVAEDPAWVGQVRWLESAVVDGLQPLLGPGVVTALEARRATR